MTNTLLQIIRIARRSALAICALFAAAACSNAAEQENEQLTAVGLTRAEIIDHFEDILFDDDDPSNGHTGIKWGFQIVNYGLIGDYSDADEDYVDAMLAYMSPYMRIDFNKHDITLESEEIQRDANVYEQTHLVIAFVDNWSTVDEQYEALIDRAIGWTAGVTVDVESLAQFGAARSGAPRCALISTTSSFTGANRERFGPRARQRTTIFIGHKETERKNYCIAYYLLSAMGFEGFAERYPSVKNNVNGIDREQYPFLSKHDTYALQLLYTRNDWLPSGMLVADWREHISTLRADN